jgi:ribonuclease HI
MKEELELKQESEVLTENSNTQEEVLANAEEKPSFVEIYTDGACSGNPGPGGYSAIIILNGEIIQISGGERLTTNNKMELMGAINGLKHIADKNLKIKLFTDSTYVQKGMTEWIEGWKRKNFKDVKNVELWKELDELSSKLNIEWHWVKAHAGHKYNEMADMLAKSEVEKNRN